MEAYSSYSSSSSSSTANGAARGALKVPQHFHSSIHSVRKPSAKPWNKKPIAPLPPTPPKVYKVDPINFRDLVQKLTGAPEFRTHQSQRLQSVAPPPLEVAVASPLVTRRDINAAPLQFFPSHQLEQVIPQKLSDSTITSNHLGFNNLSPSSHDWFSFPILSPGTLSSLEQSTVS